jgi:hypothetical protein
MAEPTLMLSRSTIHLLVFIVLCSSAPAVRAVPTGEWIDHKSANGSHPNGNGRFDPGEGYGNIEVMPDKGGFFAKTASGGGYALPMVKPGRYTITFSGCGLPAGVKQVKMGGESVLLDYQIP